MKILVFAALAEVTGKKEIEVNDIHSVNELKEFLWKNYPVLMAMNFSIAINKILVQGEAVIKDQDEVALLPPFSGG